jgi:hypothetical protein
MKILTYSLHKNTDLGIGGRNASQERESLFNL